ncbi:MAG: hypothetical protein WDZ90_00125 [Candidatus Paceibacterota bacterium]
MQIYRNIFLIASFSILLLVPVFSLEAKGAGNASGVGGSSSGAGDKGGFGDTSRAGTLGAKSLGTAKGVVSHADGGGALGGSSSSAGVSSVNLLVNGEDSLTISAPATFTLSWSADESLRTCRALGDSVGGWSTGGAYSLSRSGSRVLTNVPQGTYSYSIECRGSTVQREALNLLSLSERSHSANPFTSLLSSFKPLLIAAPGHGGRDGGAKEGRGGGAPATGSDSVSVTVTEGEETGEEDGEGNQEGVSISVTPHIVKVGDFTIVSWEGTSEECVVRGSNGDMWEGQIGEEASSPIVESTTFTLSCPPGELFEEDITAEATVFLNPKWEEF